MAAKNNTQSSRNFKIDIFRAWCKSCGICAALCPRKCIEIGDDGSPVIVSEERCTGCGWCETHCPDFAISVRAKKPEPEEAI
ncbi:MAG: 4Fe-4S dicluster domain-containing protein [Thermodesulforhabdaceae bacterium]|jgi:2-oxoglutarate ferredoxin oxidoreductase subunit delta